MRVVLVLDERDLEQGVRVGRCPLRVWVSESVCSLDVPTGCLDLSEINSSSVRGRSWGGDPWLIATGGDWVSGREGIGLPGCEGTGSFETGALVDPTINRSFFISKCLISP